MLCNASGGIMKISKIMKLSLALVMISTFAAPLLAQEHLSKERTSYPTKYGPIYSYSAHSTSLMKPLRDDIANEIEPDVKCEELEFILTNISTFESSTQIDPLSAVNTLALTKEELTENPICKEGLAALVSEAELHKEKYVEIAEITDLLSEIVGGIDNLKVAIRLNPDGNWVKGSLLAYWFWVDSVIPQKNLHYAYYLIGKGASKNAIIQAYQDEMSIKKFVKNYGSKRAKELIDIMNK